MNQAYLSKLYAINLTDRNNVFITDFNVGGGYQFGLGSKDNVLFFDQSVPNSQNDFTHKISTFDLETGKKSEVPTSEIKMQNNEYIYKGYVFKMSFL